MYPYSEVLLYLHLTDTMPNQTQTTPCPHCRSVPFPSPSKQTPHKTRNTTGLSLLAWHGMGRSEEDFSIFTVFLHLHCNCDLHDTSSLYKKIYEKGTAPAIQLEFAVKERWNILWDMRRVRVRVDWVGSDTYILFHCENFFYWKVL